MASARDGPTSPPLDPVVAHVLAAFGVEQQSLIAVRELISPAGRLQGYRVHSQDGTWMLKRHPSMAALERIMMAHELEERLGAAGFPVAPLARATSGNALVRRGDEAYSLRGWVHGQQASIAERSAVLAQQPDFAEHVGSALGTFHRLSAEVATSWSASAAVDPDTLLRAPQQRVRSLRRPFSPVLSEWQGLQVKRAKNDFDRWILATLPLVRDRATWLATQSSAVRLDTSAVSVIHNDINWENLIFDDEFRLRALLDFDNATWAPWVLELGSAAVVLVGAQEDLVEEFIGAYEQATGRVMDRGTVRLAMEMKCLQSVLTSIRSYLSTGEYTDQLFAWCQHLHESLVHLGPPDRV